MALLLLNKRSYASIEEAEVLGEKSFLECVKQGVLGSKEVFFIADGVELGPESKE